MLQRRKVSVSTSTSSEEDRDCVRRSPQSNPNKINSNSSSPSKSMPMPKPTSNSTAVLTISCEEENCDSCDADIDALPVFFNEFGRYHSTCVTCGEKMPDDFTPPTFDSVKVFKEVCIKSILPDVQIQPGVLDKSYPFCPDCTESKVTVLTDLYRQLQVLQERFDDVRCSIVASIINAFVKERKESEINSGNDKETRNEHGDRDGDKLFRYWKRYVSYPVKIDDEEEFPDVQMGKVTGRGRGYVVSGDMLIPLPIPTSPECSDGEIRVKSEPFDETGEVSPGDFSFDQNELLPVLHLENLNSHSQKEYVTAQAPSSSLPQIDPQSNITPSPFDGNNSPNSSSTMTSSDSEIECSQAMPNPKHVPRANKIPNSLIQKVAEDQLPVIYTDNDPTASSLMSGSNKRRSLTRKLLLTNAKHGSKSQIQKLNIIRMRRYHKKMNNGSESESSAGSRVLKAKRKAIRTLIRNPRCKQNQKKRIKLITSHAHQHHKNISIMDKKRKLTVDSPSSFTMSQVKLEAASSSSDCNSSQKMSYSEQLPLTSSVRSTSRIQPVVTERRRSARAANKKKTISQHVLQATQISAKRKREKPRRDKNGVRIPKTKHQPKFKAKNSTSRSKSRGQRQKKIRCDINDRRNYGNSDSSSNSGSGNSPFLSSSSEGGGEDFDLFKCTPSIIEGCQQDVKIPNFLSSEHLSPVTRPRRKQSGSPNIFTDDDGNDFFEVPPPNFFQSDEEEDENEYIKRTFATDSPPTKRHRKPSSKKREADHLEELDEDSSDDYAIGVDLQKHNRKSRSTTRKKNSRNSLGNEKLDSETKPRGRPKKKVDTETNLKHKETRGRPKKVDNELKHPQRKSKKNSNDLNESGVDKPPDIKSKVTRTRAPKSKHSVESKSKCPSSPPIVGDVVDLTTPNYVSAFSSLLTHTVCSLVKNVDPSPSPSRSRGRNRSVVYAEPNEDGDEDGLGHEDDPEASANEDSSSSSGSGRQSRSRIKKKRIINGDEKAKRMGRPSTSPKKKRVNTARMCSICGKILVSDWNLTVHMRTHTDNKPYVCEVEECGKRFYKPENLRTHMRTHTKERPYLCEICNCRFSYRVVLRTHKAAKHKIYDSEGVFECVCGERTIAETFLRKHFRSCERKRKEVVSDRFRVFCNYCEIQFEDGDEFKQHQTTDKKHIEIKTAKVAEARKELGEYQKNKNTESEAPTPEIQCKICGEKQVDARLLQIHINKAHTSKSPLTCEVCGKLFSTLGNLKTHLIIHSEDKPFICEVCGEKFNTKVSLNNHSIKHKEFSYSCDYCGKGLRKERAYRRHMCTNHKEIHLKDKPYPCPSCFQTFATTEHLTGHLSAEHMDVTCVTCGLLFGTRVELKNHVKKVHHLSDAMPPAKAGHVEDDDSSEGEQDNEKGDQMQQDLQRSSTVAQPSPPPPQVSVPVQKGKLRTGHGQQHAVNRFLQVQPRKNNRTISSEQPPPPYHNNTTFSSGTSTAPTYDVTGSLQLPLVSFDQQYTVLSQQQLDAQLQDFPHNFMYN